jgi:hypothetical protein
VSSAQAEWTKTDTLFQVADIALWTIDWGQTRHIAKDPKNYYETNGFLGEHPTVGEVDRYFLLAIPIKVGFSIILPQPMRRIWQCINIGISVKNTVSNYHIGLRMKF